MVRWAPGTAKIAWRSDPGDPAHQANPGTHDLSDRPAQGIKIKKFVFDFGKFCTRTLFWAGVILATLLMLAVLAVKYAVMPNIENYQGDIISRVAAVSGMDVSANAIRGRWSGFRPVVELENVVFREPASSTSTIRKAGDEALRLPRLEASLSWWALLAGQIRFGDFSLIGPQLALSRGADGLIYFAGNALNAPREVEDDGRMLDWLLQQPGIRIVDATLTWSDELSPGDTLRFSGVGVSVIKRGDSHEIGLVATPPASLARQVELRGTVNLGGEQGRRQFAGKLYVVATQANLGEIKRHLKLHDALHSGVANLRAWIDVDSTAAAPDAPNVALAAFNPVRAITADANVINAGVQLADDVAPLQFSRLAGRIEYVAREGGFSIASKAIEFRTREGVTSKPADFSITLLDQNDPVKASGAITGNAIDLKVITSLADYFPIGRDLRELVARYNPRGMVQQSSFAWTGYLDKPLTYRVKGTLADFSVQAHDSTPGASGFTGTIEGDDKGGKFTVASRQFELDVPQLFRAPLKFDTFAGGGAWRVNADAVEVDINDIKLENADLAGEFTGRYWRYRATGAKALEEKGPGSLDLKGKFSRIAATAVPNYLPNGIANSRDYVEWAVRKGDITSADLLLKGSIYDFPFHQGQGGTFRITARVKDLDLRYAEGWPMVNQIGADLLFENTHFEAHVDTAKIFNTPLKKTVVAIDDFAAVPPLLTIDGGADARAEEASRYIKESPLLESIGGFTRFLALDGPGKLDLSLKIPLGNNNPNRITTKFTGKYAMTRGHARLALGDRDRGTEIHAINGSVTFSESATRATNITGVAFGNPLTVSINSTENGLNTDFAARAGLPALADIIPFPMPQQVTGTADFTGRIAARTGGVDVSVESTLEGVSSALPFPLSKSAGEARRLRLQFRDAGQRSERILLTMAGNANNGTADMPESRINARFQRRFDAAGNASGFHGGVASVGDAVTDAALPEGLWLAGSMAQFDFDGWRLAFEKFYPPPATTAGAAPAKTESPLTGFDFKLGGLTAYGRPFKAMTIKGRHANEDWRMTVDSAEASGDFTWKPGAYSDRGSVRARLQRFVLADELPVAGPAPPPNPNEKLADFPALDIVAEHFTFKDRELGKLELTATPLGANWRIDQLKISNGHAQLEMDGLWQRYGDPQNPDGRSRTAMNLKLETSNLNALFDQFGYGDYMKGGKAQLEGQLSWPGHMHQFQTATLSGHMKMSASDGRFAKIEPGAGKLLGLISLQSLPSRLTLDFRDIFSEGLAFFSIKGDVNIRDGVMTTDNFSIRGPAAHIDTSGEVTLPTERVRLKSKVAPQVGETAAIGAAAILTPVVGAGVYAVSKLLQGALSYELSITGTWDNPQVEEIKKNAPPPAPAGTPPAALPVPKKSP